jgi:uncharacterized membrane protein YvlD (DUF360 family)
MNLLLDLALYTAALALVSEVLPGFEIRGGLKGTVVVALLFGVLNWALAWLLTVALGIVTLGLAWMLSVITHTIVTAGVLKVTDRLTDRLTIKSYWVALVAAALMSLTVAVLRWILG